MDVIHFETQLMKDLGVKVEHGRALGVGDLTLQGMRDEGKFDAVFVGIGNPEPKKGRRSSRSQIENVLIVGSSYRSVLHILWSFVKRLF